MSLSAAAEKYTILTVGDRLISQIPALIISVAAGMVVTRAASDKSFSEDINTQLLIQPKPMYIAASLMYLLADTWITIHSLYVPSSWLLLFRAICC